MNNTAKIATLLTVFSVVVSVIWWQFLNVLHRLNEYAPFVAIGLGVVGAVWFIFYGIAKQHERRKP